MTFARWLHLYRLPVLAVAAMLTLAGLAVCALAFAALTAAGAAWFARSEER